MGAYTLEKFSPIHLKAITLLASGKTHAEVAEQVGRSRSALEKWLEVPRFAQAVETAKNQAFAASLTKLQAYANDAIETLKRITDDEDAANGVRVRAALGLVEYAFKAQDFVTQQRLEALGNAIQELDATE